MNKYEEMLLQLKEGKIERIEIEKDQFYEFREVLVSHPLFKQNGKVIYTYLEVPRS